MQRDRISKYSWSVRGFLPGRQRLRCSFANEHSQGARWLMLSSGHNLYHAAALRRLTPVSAAAEGRRLDAEVMPGDCIASHTEADGRAARATRGCAALSGTSARLLEEKLDFVEELHSVCFQGDEVRALTDQNKPLAWRLRQLGKHLLGHIERGIGVPLGEDEKRGHSDVRRIVIWLASRPEFVTVLPGAVRYTHDRWDLRRAHRITRHVRGPPRLEPLVGHQVGPASLVCRLLRHRSVSAELGIDRERCWRRP